MNEQKQTDAQTGRPWTYEEYNERKAIYLKLIHANLDAMFYDLSKGLDACRVEALDAAIKDFFSGPLAAFSDDLKDCFY